MPSSRKDVMSEQFALFPGMLDGLPRREKTRWEELQEMNALSRERGALLPTGLAAEVLDVSRQRLYQLLDAGRIESFEFFGRKWVPEGDLLAWAKSDRTPGRRYTQKK